QRERDLQAADEADARPDLAADQMTDQVCLRRLLRAAAGRAARLLIEGQDRERVARVVERESDRPLLVRQRCDWLDGDERVGAGRRMEELRTERPILWRLCRGGGWPTGPASDEDDEEEGRS